MNLFHHPTVDFFAMLKNQPWACVATVSTVGKMVVAVVNVLLLSQGSLRNFR
jgi:hypothetical protein